LSSGVNVEAREHADKREELSLAANHLMCRSSQAMQEIAAREVSDKKSHYRGNETNVSYTSKHSLLAQRMHIKYLIVGNVKRRATPLL
jgi:hypothetical protein